MAKQKSVSGEDKGASKRTHPCPVVLGNPDWVLVTMLLHMKQHKEPRFFTNL